MVNLIPYAYTQWQLDMLGYTMGHSLCVVAFLGVCTCTVFCCIDAPGLQTKCEGRATDWDIQCIPQNKILLSIDKQ